MLSATVRLRSESSAQLSEHDWLWDFCGLSNNNSWLNLAPYYTKRLTNSALHGYNFFVSTNCHSDFESAIRMSNFFRLGGMCFLDKTTAITNIMMAVSVVAT